MTENNDKKVQMQTELPNQPVKNPLKDPPPVIQRNTTDTNSSIQAAAELAKISMITLDNNTPKNPI